MSSQTEVPVGQMEDPLESKIKELHRPFFPAEIYAGERIIAEILRSDESGKGNIKLPVWRISPLGIELLISDPDKNDLDTINVGDVVGLRVSISDQLSVFRGLVVKTKFNFEAKTLIGIRWAEAEKKGFEVASKAPLVLERRRSERWLCGSDFLPTGVAPNPARFNDFIYFRVYDISARGMLILTSMRNRYLIPGIYLNSSISFPMCSQMPVRLKIISARAMDLNGKQYLALGVEMVDASRRTLSTIGQYIFQFGPKASIEDLKRSGLTVPSASQGLDFSFVRTDEEYRRVLELRRECYELAGKIKPGTPPTELSDIYDSRARILIARHRGQIVATLRIIFHGPEDNFEIEEHVKLPADFPRKDDCVEISRLCTHPAFRQSDLFYAIAKRTMITVAQAKRRWIVSFASPQLLPLYRKIGAGGIGLTFKHRALGGMDHEVITWNIARTLSGKNVNPFVWNALFYDMAGYIWDSELIESDPMLNLRLSVYKLFRPLTPILLHRIRKNAK